MVWDWNGTLLDDFALTARIAARTLASMGTSGIAAEDVRAAFRRPFADFYARLLGRPVSGDDYAYIRARYEREYGAEVYSARLQPDALDALDHVAAAQATQSLLSMAHDEQLQALVDHHRLRHRFLRVDGSPTPDSDGSKAARLVRHLADMAVDPAQAVIIGDTVDDHEAARFVGARSVLVTTGSTSRESLLATEAPVVDTLLAASNLAVGDR